ncbi:GntR family transcriptional regulator [Acuticoccus mangrovi]|uniref:GntR family transcriptional regulator n=1 Tax=Acuticoccus mangrovi TaxID=2796142 RepID=A0A934ILG4_9HYPH|nr:GntR family transcriptional regulator [Acuticoccus mangrovi]MBJ3775997.1 GntR family transcriptional regulator [Acuticoccus mangrovi]
MARRSLGAASGGPITAAEYAFQSLHDAILSGDLVAGERLTEVAVGEMLNISRTPVRDAFGRLQQAGLIEASPSNGWTVVDVKRDVTDVHLLREAIEGMAARLAAVRGSEAEHGEIMRLARQSQATDLADVTARAVLNRAFHAAIVAAAHSPRVARLSADYESILVSPHVLKRYRTEESVHTLDDHLRIAELIAARKADAAEEAMRAHLRFAFDRLMALVPPSAADEDADGMEPDGEGDGAP